MKPGDLVEFKAGLFGIKPPQNLGIYLDRVREKGTYFAVLYTLRGKQNVKPDNITARRLNARVPPDELEGDLSQRLKQLIEEVTKGKVRDEQRLDDEATDRDLWQRVKEQGGEALTPDDIANAYFDTKAPTKGQVTQIKKVLESAREPGVGYFERAPGREERWVPITREQHVSFHREKDGIQRLRNKLVVVEEVEDEEGYLRTVYRGIPLGEADLDEQDRARLDFIGRAMQDFVLNDRFTGAFTLGESGKHTLDGFSLFPFLKFLALDWTGAERVSVSSAFIEFLVDADMLGLDEAVELVARRKVRAQPNFGWEIPADVLRAAERAPAEIPPEVIAQRRDLRDVRIFTIDPPDARDHDDAVGIEEHDDGSATLWVAIADVSHYVERDSTLDHEARKRATSVYLPTGVLPMLPPRLSNDLCSLEPQKDRLAMVAKLTVAPDGRVVAEEAMEAVVRVAANVPYPDVQRELEHGDPANEFVKLRKLADRMDRHRRGLAIETAERKIHLTPETVQHVEKMGTPATRMIETFMVAANEAVARILTREEVPVLYRCHPLPDRSSVDRFNAQCRTMEVPVEITLPEPERPAEDAADADGTAGGGGESLLDQLKKGKMQMFGGGSFSIKGLEPEPEEAPEEDAPAPDGPPKPIVKGLAQLTDEEQEAWLRPFREALVGVARIEEGGLKALVYLKTLSTMGRAFYTPANLGHFGLGSTCYAHFTSPIRRYPDLVVHRQLRWLLRGREGDPPHDVASLEILASHTSDQGSTAESLERGTVDSAMVFKSREEQWAGPQRALVNGLTRGGAFLSIEGGLEARISMSDIPGGPFAVDENESMLFAGEFERSSRREEVTAKNWRELVDPETEEVRRVRLRLGDRVSVQIAARDYVDGKVAAKLLE